jgi:hypothetical protein
MNIGDLFQPDPPRWGLRGDPMLWQDMRAVLCDRPLPDNVDELRDLLHRSYDALTGHKIDEDESAVRVAAYRREGGGMSNGQVSPAFWRDTAIPLIEKRFLGGIRCYDDS